MAGPRQTSVLRLGLFGFVLLKLPALFIFTILLQIVAYKHFGFFEIGFVLHNKVIIRRSYLVVRAEDAATAVGAPIRGLRPAKASATYSCRPTPSSGIAAMCASLYFTRTSGRPND